MVSKAAPCGQVDCSATKAELFSQVAGCGSNLLLLIFVIYHHSENLKRVAYYQMTYGESPASHYCTYLFMTESITEDF